MAYTWDDANMISIRNKYSINDFTPKSQDIFCVLILKYKRKKSLNLIMEGKIDNALEILSYEWASLPPGRYGQPAKSKKEALVLYENYLNEELQGISDLFISLGTIEKIANGDY